MINKQKLKIVIIGIITLFLLYYFVMHKSHNTTQKLQAASVIVEKPKLMPMTKYLTLTGNTVAYNSVDLVARVKGYLEAIKFVDGSFVKKDQLLFIIEPKPYLETLKAAQATVAMQKANLAYAEAEYARQQRMYKQNATSLNSVEKWQAKRDESKAAIAQAKADEINAAINYSYTEVKATFDGRIGRHLVDPGNLVGNGAATKLATLEQLSPIYVYFNLNELDFIKIRDAARKLALTQKEINQIPVFVGTENQTNYPYKGVLDFVNTSLNASTGTIELRALLTNKKISLVPGLFVRVRIPLSKPKQQLTVPDTALLYDQIGAYLLIAGKNNIVEQKRVTLGSLESGRYAIVKGLQPNDEVIIHGLQNATPGRTVAPTSQKNK